MTDGLEFLKRLRRLAVNLKRDLQVIGRAALDRRTPWYAKLLVVIVVAYAVSPIDLIPDFIPVLGLLDDIVLIPIGIALAIRWIPDAVLDDCRLSRTHQRTNPSEGTNIDANVAELQVEDHDGATWQRGGRIAAGVIIVIWITLGVVTLRSLG